MRENLIKILGYIVAPSLYGFGGLMWLSAWCGECPKTGRKDHNRPWYKKVLIHVVRLLFWLLLIVSLPIIPCYWLMDWLQDNR
jgi:hypothetical protein